MSAAQIDPVKLERKRALQRAGLAAVAALVLLIGVLVAEDGREPASAVTLAAPQGAGDAPLPSSPVVVEAPPAAGTENTAPAAPDPAAVAPLAAFPAAAVEASPDVAPVANPPTVADASPPAATSAPAGAAPSAAAATPAVAPAAPLPDGYLVQLGVFGAMENAEALRTTIAALGLPVRIEGRVVVGPFRDKAAADAAQGKLRREGMAVGFVVPPRAASGGARPGK